MKFEVYKYRGYLYDNINDRIVNKNIFVSVVLGFQKFWMEAYNWCLVCKVQG